MIRKGNQRGLVYNISLFLGFNYNNITNNITSSSLIYDLGLFHLKVWGGRRNGRFFEGGEGPNSELVYTIRVYMISGRRGRGVSNI